MPDVQRVALVAARLVALANQHLGIPIERAMVTELGSAGAAAAADGKVVFDPGNGAAALGAAIAWAQRVTASGGKGAGASEPAEINPAEINPAEINIVVEPRTDRRLGVWARQAAEFEPRPRVWKIVAGGGGGQGQLLEVEPEPFPRQQIPPPQAAELELLLRQAGLDVVVEHGVILGELRGLEVARVEEGPDGEPQLHVGVGRFDQEASALLQGDLTRPDALARVVELIAPHRSPGAAPHPVNRLSRERWLRYQILTDPSLVGAATLDAVEAPEPRGGLRDTAVAVAVGERPDATPLVVVTSDGVDLEVIPRAADARAWHDPKADLVVVVPSGNRHPAIERIAARLKRPAVVLDLAPEWPR